MGRAGPGRPRVIPGTPVGLYLTWQEDPSTTMTIDWHSIGGEDAAVLEYRAAGSNVWQPSQSRSVPFPRSGRTIHRVELTALEPATTHRFRVGQHSRVYSFRTMPSDASEPIRFAAGGDTRHDQLWMEETNRQVLAYDPDFIIFGGDLLATFGAGLLPAWLATRVDAAQHRVICDLSEPPGGKREPECRGCAGAGQRLEVDDPANLTG